MAGAGRNRAARGGFPVRRGWEAVPVVLSGVPTAAGKVPGARQGRGETGRRGAVFRSGGGGKQSQ